MVTPSTQASYKVITSESGYINSVLLDTVFITNKLYLKVSHQSAIAEIKIKVYLNFFVVFSDPN